MSEVQVKVLENTQQSVVTEHLTDFYFVKWRDKTLKAIKKKAEKLDGDLKPVAPYLLQEVMSRVRFLKVPGSNISLEQANYDESVIALYNAFLKLLEETKTE